MGSTPIASKFIKTKTRRISGGTTVGLFKRLFDICISFIGLLLLSPFLLFIALRIKKDSPGPIFFRGDRVGKDGRIFQILKFRTMHEDPKSYQGPKVTARDDPRITTVGKWLRDTKLNELPQLWNVFIGEMSLVGPRPEDPEIADTWPRAVRDEVLSVRPGITSPASVLYRDEEELLSSGSVMDTYLDTILPSKLRLDQLYVRNRSFLLDLDILFWTFLVLLPNRSQKSPPEESLFLGPISKITRRYVRWLFIDALITFSAVAISGVIWRLFGPLNIGLGRAILFALGFAISFSVMGALLGVNRISWASASSSDVVDLVLPFIVAATLVFFTNRLAFQPYGFPIGLIITATLVAFVGFVLVRYQDRVLRGAASRWLKLRGGAKATQERVLVVGGGQAGQFAVWLLSHSPNMQGFHVVGFVDDDLFKQGLRIQGVNVLGKREDIPGLVENNDIGIIVFAIHNISSRDREDLLDICAGTSARILMMPDILAAMHTVSNGRNTEEELYIMDLLNTHGVGNDIHRVEGSLHPYVIEGWLSNLLDLAQSGDMEAVSEQIMKYRKQILADSMENELIPNQ